MSNAISFVAECEYAGLPRATGGGNKHGSSHHGGERGEHVSEHWRSLPKSAAFGGAWHGRRPHTPHHQNTHAKACSPPRARPRLYDAVGARVIAAKVGIQMLSCLEQVCVVTQPPSFYNISILKSARRGGLM